MASKLPKPSGLRPPQLRVTKPLGTIPESHLNRAQEAPPVMMAQHFPSFRTRLQRRSKSVTDLRALTDRPIIDIAGQARKLQSCKKSENKPVVPNKNTPPKKGQRIIGSSKTGPTKSGTAGTKRPLPATKNSTEGQPKAKVAKKIPDWDFKSRFHQLNEKYSSAQESIKEMKLKMNEFSEMEEQYETVQTEVQELRLTKESLTEQCSGLSERNNALTQTNNKFEHELAILDKKHKQLEADHSVLEENNNKLSLEKQINTKEIERLSRSLKELTERYEELTENYENLSKKHVELTAQYTLFTKENKDLLEKVAELQKKNEELNEALVVRTIGLQELHADRRILHNVIQDLKGNIRVFCRIRPPINEEEQMRLQCCFQFHDDNGIEIKRSKESISQITGKVQETKSEFTFDKVFAQNSRQDEIFEDLAQLVQSALDGYDICVFAYGQTGSGKTHTMQGPPDNPEEKGMIPRTIDLIFQRIAELERSDWTYTVHASFLEIYNENVRDLLNMNSAQKLEICFNKGKGTTVTNLTIKPINSAEELKESMSLAHLNRATAVTNFNEHSSRSHAVTKIYLEGTVKGQNLLYRGSINLVDLAGSESAKQSLGEERLKETKHINKSLATLGDVISALYSKSPHQPYRDSKLTYLLQSSLGGNSKTLMVVNIAPFEDCFNESINSLRFAAKVKLVKTASKKNKMTLLPPSLVKQNSTLT